MSFQQYPFKGGVPTGTLAQRPGSPATGDVFYNGTDGILEIYNGTDWVPCSAPAGTPVVAVTDVGTSRAYTSGAISYTFTPQATGGAPLGYTAVSTTASTATVYQTTTSSTTVTLSVGLPGTYTIYGNSYNGFGTSPNSVPSTVEVTTVPQAPTIGTAATSNSTTDVTVTWTLGSNGGKNLSAITITPYLNGTTAQTSQTAATTSSTSYTFTGASALTVGNSYTFKVKTTNANGNSLDSSATNSVTVPVIVEYLVVAGGAGGGGNRALDYAYGGGGAGGFATGNLGLLIGTAYTVTVGAGGAHATKGGNSVFSSITRSGGGAGGGTNLLTNGNADAGGSGGGGMGQSALSPGAGNLGGYTPVEGYAGGQGTDAGNTAAGGGGGASAAGGAGSGGGSSMIGGNGGAGTASSITGSSVTYAGGGGGGVGYSGGPGSTGGSGGAGGGGNGSTSNSATAGTANRGGGGGGNRGGMGYSSAAGGSGVVIIKYPDSYTPTISGGLTSSTPGASGGYKVTTFTAGTGTVTF